MRQEVRTCVRTASSSSGLLMVVWRSNLGVRLAEGVTQEAVFDRLVVVELRAKRRGVWVVPGRRALQPCLVRDLKYVDMAFIKGCKKG